MPTVPALSADLDLQTFQRAVTGMAFLTTDGKVVRANLALCRVLGCDDSHLRELSWQELVHADDLAALQDSLSRLLTAEISSCQRWLRLIHGRGYSVKAQLTVSVVWDGDVRMLLAQVQENTTRQTSMAPVAPVADHLDRLFDSLPEGLLVEDERRTICLASSRLSQVLEFQDRTRQLVGIQSDIIKSEIASISADSDEFRTRVAELRARCSVVRAERISMNDGRTLERDYIPLGSEGEPRSHLWVYRDVTNRVEAEKFNYERYIRLRKWNSRLAALASTDALTGLPNRRSLHQRLIVALRQAARDGQPLSLALLDVDRFKDFNDNFGHPAGDEVLKSLAMLFRSVLRPDDVPARFGGEEFAVLMPRTSSTEALLVAERCRLALVRAVWPLRPVTASFGVATVVSSTMREDAAAHVLIASADAALYRSKAAGRNRITHAEDPFGEFAVTGASRS